MSVANTTAASDPDTAIPSNQTVSLAMQDVVQGLRDYELWTTIGWHDIRQRYRRSVVGPFWITISMAAMIVGISYMYSGLFDQQFFHYISYVAMGIIVFSLISTIVNEAADVFISSARIILQTKVPFSVYVYRMIWRNILLFAHNFIIYCLLVLFGFISIGPQALLAVAGLLFIVFNGVWIGLLLGPLSARFRDVPPIISSLMQLAFFLTPVFWRPEQMQGRQVFVILNPFYYMVDMVRMPLLGQVPPPHLWYVSIAMCCIGTIVGIVFFARYRRRIAYWVS
jgi:ABC-2 type transport system permease protein/lipopolysaccharide transport system permease protein